MAKLSQQQISEFLSYRPLSFAKAKSTKDSFPTWQQIRWNPLHKRYESKNGLEIEEIVSFFATSEKEVSNG